MGYALFANRKVMYTRQLADLQTQLDVITEKRTELSNYASSIEDGLVSVDEMFNDMGNYEAYTQYQAGLEQFVNSGYGTVVDSNGNAVDLATMYYGPNATEEQRLYLQQQQFNETAKQYGKYIARQIENQEKEIDMQEKKIETKIAAVQKQLEAVEQAEGQAIDRATPKYNGVG
ncbi:hypothetical protein II906_09070 [bacterium]|nr:hypothetical protein [bacterium]